MFEVKNRAGCTRSGMLSGQDWKMPTPMVLGLDTGRFPADPFAEAVLKGRDNGSTILVKADGQSTEAYDIPAYSGMAMSHSAMAMSHSTDASDTPGLTARDKVCIIRPETAVEDMEKLRGQTEFFVLENSIELYQNSRTFIDSMVRIREAIGFQAALYLPGVALPNNLALLVYLGVDVLDPTRVALLTGQDYFLTCDGSWQVSELKGESCSCAACLDEDADRERLFRHNILALRSELQRVRSRIARGDIREFVEYRAKTAPRLVEMMRHLDKRFYSFQEERFPAVSGRFRATTRLSLERPDVMRFRERIINRYRKPETPNVLLLLPCSARKPYSDSRSHKLFRRAIKGSGAGLMTHELIITSPLGLVPRELELFYPAQHYDIPVTGHWYEDEKVMINSMLEKYIKNNNYSHIINHLGESDLIESIDAEPTVIGRPTSDDSLASLKKVLGEFREEKAGKTWKIRSAEEVASMAGFQFGPGAAEMLKGSIVKGRYPRLRIFRGKEQLASISPTNGQVIPTLQGAEFLAQNDIHCVNIHDFKITGNLFAVGVESASPEIRTGDEVAVVRNGEIRAVGTARMCAREMVESDRGEAVRVRHRANQ